MNAKDRKGSNLGLITTIRAPVMIGENPGPALSAEARRPAEVGVAAPVAPTALRQAVQQPTALSQVSEGGLLEARMAADIHAEAAVEAAREAYIKASIAAGINPLPVP